MANKPVQLPISGDKVAVPGALLAILSDHERWIASGKREGQRANLQGQDFSRVDLSGRDLRGAILTDASFRHANLRDADFRDLDEDTRTVLTGADFGGADLTDVRFPDKFRLNDTLANIAEACKICRQNGVVLVVAAAFLLLTLVATNDLDRLTGQVTLPLLSTAVTVPLRIFLLIAPAVLFALFVVFQGSLHRIWKLISICPAWFPDGTSLECRLYPWFTHTVVSSQFRQLGREDRPLMGRLQLFVTISVVWWATALALLVMWVATWPEREAVVTWTQIAAVAFAMLGAQFSYLQMSRVLRDGNPKANPLRDVFLGSPVRAMVLILIISLSFVLGYVSYRTIQGNFANHAYAKYVALCPERDTCAWYGHIFQLPLADFRGVDASTINRTIDLQFVDIRYAIARRANFTGARFDRAQMDLIDLGSAKLRRATLKSASLDHADLESSDLSDADLTVAILTKSYLHEATLAGTKLAGADLTGADLTGATLAGADLTGASLTGTTLAGADLTGADLRQVDLRGVQLTADQLDSACLDPTTTLPDGTHPSNTSKSCPKTGSNQ